MEYLHRQLTERIIGVYHEVYSTLGRGFFERIYHRAMLIALADAGLGLIRSGGRINYAA